MEDSDVNVQDYGDQNEQFTAANDEPEIPPPTITIDEVGRYEFVAFDGNGAEVLKRHYRIICEPISEAPSTSACLPLVVLPEQVQVLFENGYANVRRLAKIEGIDPTEAIVNNNGNRGNEEENGGDLISLARRIAIGRKIKSLKRKALGGDACSSLLKVRKSDDKLYADVGDSLTDAELKTAVDELRAKKEGSVGQQVTPLSAPSSSYEEVELPEFPNGAEYRRRLVTFRDLWRKGFYLTPGTKFGCDYLAYEKPPGEAHSTYMVVCVDAVGDALRPLDLIAISRVGSQVKKQILLAIVSADSLIPYYINANWWKGNK